MSKLNWGKRACAVLILCAATAIALPAQTFTTLYSFCSQSGCTDGYVPYAGLIQATDGNLYGTAVAGGANNNDCPYGEGCGTVFKITPGGTLTTLYSFALTDGEYPYSAPIQAIDGNLYGTTYSGGLHYGGTVFKITASGTLTTLYSFCSQTNCTDGGSLYAGLIQAIDGNLYGTTRFGGANDYGTVFKITPSGTLTTLYSFCPQSGCVDGANPYAALMQANDGNLYGTTYSGGANGDGTVFEITPSGAETTLYSFCSQSGCTDGASPYAGLVQATDGNFYGTTYSGGANGTCYAGGCGTVFKITPSGTLTTLYNFCSQSGCTDGSRPNAGLVQATDGNLYGTTYSGGANGYGTVFKITASGALTTLYSFCSQSGCADGNYPYAGLVQDTNGSFYGTTLGGGAHNEGTVFRLPVGLSPFVETQPTFGAVGKTIKILGTNLAGATSVTFNGTPAVFTVLRNSVISATVPVGATTGTVQVTTPSGTLSSNVRFRVAP